MVELLVGLGILSIVTLAVAALSRQMSVDFKSASERVSQEEAADQIAYHLKQALSNSVELKDPSPDALGATYFSNQFGQITKYNLESSWNATDTAKADTLALFFRDNLMSINMAALPADSERFTPIGIFFTRPTPQTYGVLTIDLGDKDTRSLPTESPAIRFTHIVNFKMYDLVTEDILNSATGKVEKKIASLMVTFTTRVYKADARENARWCPPARMTEPECATEYAYHDLTKTFEIVMRNNLLGPSTARRLGKTDPITHKTYYEPVPRRAIEGVYFLRPFIPVPALNR